MFRDSWVDRLNVLWTAGPHLSKVFPGSPLGHSLSFVVRVRIYKDRGQTSSAFESRPQAWQCAPVPLLSRQRLSVLLMDFDLSSRFLYHSLPSPSCFLIPIFC